MDIPHGPIRQNWLATLYELRWGCQLGKLDGWRPS